MLSHDQSGKALRVSRNLVFHSFHLSKRHLRVQNTLKSEQRVNVHSQKTRCADHQREQKPSLQKSIPTNHAFFAALWVPYLHHVYVRSLPQQSCPTVYPGEEISPRESEKRNRESKGLTEPTQHLTVHWPVCSSSGWIRSCENSEIHSPDSSLSTLCTSRYAYFSIKMLQTVIPGRMM